MGMNSLHQWKLFQDTNILGFKGPRNMTVLLPGMTEEDQRVKISSADDGDQGLLECWKAKVKTLILSHTLDWNNQK